MSRYQYNFDRHNKHKTAACWSDVAICATVIFLLSSISFATPFHAEPWDKLAHMFEYTVFGYLLVKACDQAFNFRMNAELFLCTIILGFLFAVSDEIHQSFIPLRDSSAMDVMADLVGLLISCLLWTRLPILKRFSFTSKCLGLRSTQD